MHVCAHARTPTLLPGLLVEVGRRPVLGLRGWERLALSPAVLFPLHLVAPRGPKMSAEAPPGKSCAPSPDLGLVALLEAPAFRSFEIKEVSEAWMVLRVSSHGAGRPLSPLPGRGPCMLCNQWPKKLSILAAHTTCCQAGGPVPLEAPVTGELRCGPVLL